MVESDWVMLCELTNILIELTLTNSGAHLYQYKFKK
jgi:hypothetical protein